VFILVLFSLNNFKGENVVVGQTCGDLQELSALRAGF
jgi:hypothetical protein